MMTKRTVVVIGVTGSQAGLPTWHQATQVAYLGDHRADLWLQNS